jgi:hypothetical protein
MADTEQQQQLKDPLKPRGRGRPKKGEIVAKKPKNRGVIGRPPGDKAIMDEYKARMLNSPKSAKVLETILNAALDDNHKNQAVAWKLVIDRVVPVSAFEQAKQGNSAPAISINIMGLNQANTTIDQDSVSDSVDVDISDVEAKYD